MYRMPISPTLSNPDTRTVGISLIPDTDPNAIDGNSVFDVELHSYCVPIVSNPRPDAVNVSMNQTTAIRIDDSIVHVRRTWSSDKIANAKADSQTSIIEDFVAKYGELYLSTFDPTQMEAWQEVFDDAEADIEDGKPFLIPWNEYQTAQVITSTPDEDVKLVFFFNGKLWDVSENGVVPEKTHSGDILMDTTAHWDEQVEFIPDKGTFVVYSDHATIQGVDYCGVKIGDGVNLLADLPFFGDELNQKITAHINNTGIHVTSEEKTFWSNKLNYTLNGDVLVLNRN